MAHMTYAVQNGMQAGGAGGMHVGGAGMGGGGMHAGGGGGGGGMHAGMGGGGMHAGMGGGGMHAGIGGGGMHAGMGGGGMHAGGGGMHAGTGMHAGGGGMYAGGGGMHAGGAGGGGACCAKPGGEVCSAVCDAESCCGTAVACGTGGGGAGSLAFVGSGFGSYTTETQYRYVGAGCGELEFVKPAPNYCICVVSSSILLLLLALLLWFLLKDSTNTTININNPTSPTCISCLNSCAYSQSNGCGMLFAPSGSCSLMTIVASCSECAPLCGPVKPCIVWGDPHVESFDGVHVSFYSAGEYWIVKSIWIYIQGKYAPTHATSGLAVMKAIAFAGPFLQGHRLIIGVEFASFDGQPVLQGFPSSFDHPLVKATYDGQGETMQSNRGGKALHVIHLSLPGAIAVQINRWMEPAEGLYINAKIMMIAVPGQDGHCGNFNGNPADDARLAIRQRIGTTGVAAAEILFPGGKTPCAPANRPDVNDCPILLEKAKDVCKKKEKKFIPSMSCLIDVCFGGKGFADEDGDEGM